ncbi:MAG: response regulator [Gammaproteobacteria bacterium]|nr:response regulator [Gammaproteobacteria bacterium]NNK33757.1 response regulator [Xanthomonadales bacterium]
MNTLRDILVIEDEPIVTRAVVMVCGDEDMTVTAVESAREAFHSLQRHRYRLALCDIMMQGVDGFEFLAELSRRGFDVPVVMMTGYSTVENALKSLLEGAVDFIPKPFTADELLTVIRRALRYSSLLKTHVSARVGGRERMNFVSCPDNYLKLGCVSWVLMEEEGTARIGIRDLFLKSVQEISGFELAEPGEGLVQGIPCAEAKTSDGSTHHIMCPMSGKVLEVNDDVRNNPSLVEKDPYFKGWLYQILPSDPEDNLQWLRL